MRLIIQKFFFIFISFALFAIISWRGVDQAQSYVSKFIYEGNGDTTSAAVGGRIKERCNESNCMKDHPIADVVIKFRGMVTRTDGNGKFRIWFGGKGELLLEKKGYQSVKILNLNGPSDEFFYTEVFLAKGSGVVEFDCEQELLNNR